MTASLLTVGLETSGMVGSVAVLRDGVLVAERILGETGRRHARTLIAELDELLKSQIIAPKTVDHVAVSIGPGSFTGLRVGVVAAKCWGFVTGCRVVGVGTFEAIVETLPAAAASAWIIDDALRGDVYCQKFRRDANCWIADGNVNLQPFDSWLDGAHPDDVVGGPGAVKWAADIKSRGLTIAAGDSHHPTAASVARCGFAAATTGRFDDPFQLTPLYIRRSAAEEKLDAQEAGTTP